MPLVFVQILSVFFKRQNINASVASRTQKLPWLICVIKTFRNKFKTPSQAMTPSFINDIINRFGPFWVVFNLFFKQVCVRLRSSHYVVQFINFYTLCYVIWVTFDILRLCFVNLRIELQKTISLIPANILLYMFYFFLRINNLS